jgi:hypothetical protein
MAEVRELALQPKHILAAEPGNSPRRSARFVVLALTLVSITAPLALHQSGMSGYAMSWDDFPLVRDGLHWEQTQRSLWQPFNNHLFPLFRLLTWSVVAAAGRLSAVPDYLFFAWLVGLAVSLLTLYEFVSRETGCTTTGWVAVLLAGMTSTYHLSAGLYATTQIFWAIAFCLIMLVCLQSMRDGFRWSALVAAAVVAMLAPAWRTEGVLAGPLGSLYCLSGAIGTHARQRAAAIIAPSAGTCMFLAVVFAMCGMDFLGSPGSINGAPLVTFDPIIGAYLTARMATEHLLLWNLGLRGELSTEQFLVLFALLVGVGVFWARRAPRWPLVMCGLGLMIFSYMLVYTTRGNLALEGVRRSPWYLIFPHFGWALFVSAGLAPMVPTQVGVVGTHKLIRVASLGLALYLLHRPVIARMDEPALAASQRRELKELEQIEKLSHRDGIDATSLREAIGPVRVSGGDRFDGLSLILPPRAAATRGPDEVRQLVRDVLDGHAGASGTSASLDAGHR